MRALLKSVWGWINARRWRRGLFEVGLVGLLVLGVMKWQSRHLLEGGIAAPDFTAVTLDGSRVSLSSYQGKPLLLVFWSPWCKVCRLTSSNISAIHRSGTAQVLAVALSYESVADVEQYMREQEVDYPVVLGDSSVSKAYHVEVFPTFYMISATGQITSQVVGYTTEWGMKLRL